MGLESASVSSASHRIPDPGCLQWLVEPTASGTGTWRTPDSAGLGCCAGPKLLRHRAEAAQPWELQVTVRPPADLSLP